MSDVAADDIRSKAQSALAESQIHDLRSLEIGYEDGRIVISGSVSRFYYKQLAQELVLGVDPELKVVNVIHVR